MKNLKRFIFIICAAVLALSIGLLVGCGSGVDYTFEAEDAEFPETSTIATDAVIWSENGDSEETVTGVENYYTVGHTITWKVVSPKSGKATITLHASSVALMQDGEDYELVETDFATTEAYELKVNGVKVNLTGVLPKTVIEGGWAGMGAPGVWWHMGTASGAIKLKEGENEIVLEIVGAPEGVMRPGLNVDKIVINSKAELTAKS